MAVGNTEEDATPKTLESCPHCGRQLSAWEKVLLSVDRALMCKHCWYRIYLNSTGEPEQPTRERE